jgi:hypothetical protein
MLTWVWNMITLILSHITTIKDAAQSLAFLAALIYFFYKVKAGYLVVNTSIDLEVVRSAASETTDMVAITVLLERGQLGTLVLHDVRARACWGESKKEFKDVEFKGINRLSYDKGPAPVRRKQATFDREGLKNPFLHLAPGEKASYGACVEVPATAPCTVSAVALGCRVGGRRTGQWRASRVILPRAFVAKP